MSAATSIVGVGLLSLPNAYPAEKESIARKELLQTMLLLLMGLVLLSTVGAIGLKIVDRSHAAIHVSGLALALFPLLVFTCGVRQIIIHVAIGRAHFNSTALGQIIEPIFSRGGAITLGALFGGHPAFILVATMLGQVVAAATICRMLLKNTLGQWRAHFCLPLKTMPTLRRHSDSIFYNTAAQQTQSLAMLGIQLAIATFCSGEAAGHYILATSIITMPVTLIALATAPVVYHHFIQVELNAPHKLMRDVGIAVAAYLVIGLFILAPIFFWGEWIFKFAFGSKWAAAGAISSTLSIAYVGLFAMIGVQSVFRVTKRLKLQFVLELFASIAALLLGVFCFKAFEFNTAVWWVSGVWFLRNTMLLCAAVYVAYEHAKKRAT
jgi:O-antigen/teichoic acid export membrane protein